MTSRSTASKRGASKSSGSRKKSNVSIPGWIWLVTGLALGFFIAFLMGLTPGAVDVRIASDKEAAKIEPDDINKPVFDFYTLLPESEVSVPVETIPVLPKKIEPSKASGSAAKAIEVDRTPKNYLLQVGSFRNSKDADRLRAQLLLEGLNPRVDKVNVGSGESWYRVQLGPFSDQKTLQSTRSILAGKKIDSLLLQVK
ncbi:hypothetical protein ACH42_15395 [Endozoicomonas sp. (ex Bugula neritina AB1)]|nr:hypothetical protein ACH42_15395 [Endozoicomonas sp. (ex Bugula neritina AB1)]